MSAVGTVRIVWSNGEDDFCISKVGTILALEEKCGAGIGEIRMRLQAGTWRLHDVRETIRLGLIGAGMDADRAMRAVKLHVDEQPLAKSVLIAHAICAAALVGVPGDDVGKKPAAGAATGHHSTTTMAASAAQPHTASAPV